MDSMWQKIGMVVMSALCATHLWAQTTVRVSVTNAGVQGNGPSKAVSISADGRYVAFLSQASNLVANDTNGRVDVFVKDLQSGALERVNISSAGAQAIGDDCGSLPPGGAASLCSTPVISADGRFVAFVSSASNFGTGGQNQIFRRDRLNGVTDLVSKSSGNQPGDFSSYDPSISPDGRFIAFMSFASNLGSGVILPRIYVRDMLTGITQGYPQTTSASPGAPNNNSGSPVISADGRRVVFFSFDSTLVPGDTNGLPDLFLWDRQLSTTVRVSVATGGAQSNGGSGYQFGIGVGISDNGNLVAFPSRASNLVAGDTNGRDDIFLRNIAAGTTQRITPQQDGSSGSAAISGDGSRIVLITSATNLVAGDNNGVSDVYSVGVADASVARQSVSSTGVSANNSSPSYASHGWTAVSVSTSQDGSKVVFDSDASNLVSDDSNGTTDVFVRSNVSAPAGPSINLIIPNSPIPSCDVASTQVNKTQVSWSSSGATYCLASEAAPAKTNWGQLPCLGSDCPDPADVKKLRPNQGSQDVYVYNGNISQTVNLILTCYSAAGASTSVTRGLVVRPANPGECPIPSYSASSVVSTPVPQSDGSVQFQATVANPQGLPLSASIAQQGRFGDATAMMSGNTVVVRYYPRPGASMDKAIGVSETIKVFIGDSSGGVMVTYNFAVDLPFAIGPIDEPNLARYTLPAPSPANPNCPAGYFTAVVDDGPGSGLSSGAFGMEVLLDDPGTRVLAGGLNFGGLIDVGQVGFAAFNIANAANENQRLFLNLSGSPAGSGAGSLPVRVRIGRRPDVNTNITVFETTTSISLANPFVTTVDLPPAFYEATVAPISGTAGGGAEGQFFFSLTTSFVNRAGGGFQGGAVVGGYHTTHPFGGVSGFAGFCLATSHTASVRVLSQPSYGSNGARDLRLRIQDAQQRDLTAVPSNGSSPNNAAPSATFIVGATGLIANFRDTSSDVDGTIVSRTWNFGDGGTSNAPNPSHTYARFGTYNVTLTVTDNGGASNSLTRVLTLSGSVADAIAKGGSVNYRVVAGRRLEGSDRASAVRFIGGVARRYPGAESR